MKINKEKLLNIGDEINITGLKTKIEDFVTIAGETMVRTPYGDFNLDLILELNKNEKKNN